MSIRVMRILIALLLIANVSYAQDADSEKGKNGIYTRINLNYNSPNFIGRSSDEYPSGQAAINKMNSRMLGGQLKIGYSLNNWNISINYRHDRIYNLINVSRLSPYTNLFSTDFEVKYGINSVGLGLGKNLYINDNTYIGLNLDVYRTFGSSFDSGVKTSDYDQLYFDTVSTYDYNYTFYKSSDWSTNVAISLNTETAIGDFGLELNWMIIPRLVTTLNSTEYFKNHEFNSTETSALNRGYYGFSLIYAWNWGK